MRVSVRTVSGRQLQVEVADPVAVLALRDAVAAALDKPSDGIRLIHSGEALHITDPPGRITEDSGVVLAMPVRRAPSQSLRDAYDGGAEEEEEADLRYKLPADASPRLRQAVHFCKHTLKMPDLMLVWVFGFSVRAYLGVTLWLLGCPVASRLDLGPPYILASLITFIFVNLGKKKQGESSAYSVFNEDFRELPGQLNAGVLDQQLRRGQM